MDKAGLKKQGQLYFFILLKREQNLLKISLHVRSGIRELSSIINTRR